MDDDLKNLAERIRLCRGSDRPRLRRRLRGIERARAGGRGGERPVRALAQDIAASIHLRDQRRANLPVPNFPDDLPVSARRDEIAAAIAEHQVVVVCGQTGSGKTTQLPKICLSLGRGVDGLIGHTQPRRIAARSVAARIADEIGSPIGRHVGYKVRFADHVRESCHVKLMTDGILLAETQGDPMLAAYDTLIIDEAHERSLNIDFLLGYVHRLLPRRPDLKVVITSATIDPQRFSDHFRGAPIVEVSGRMYPVEVRYRPPQADDDEDLRERDLVQAVVDAVDEAASIDSGDILVFLPGEREIRATAEALTNHHVHGVSDQQGGVEVVPLYARLSAAEQNRVFAPHPGRRVVLATNVAETSLTVPGIRFVIDSGLARISRYSSRTKVQRLPIERISRASAEQRKGRCGRVAEGVCFRLYSHDDFESREPFTPPEILRTNLAAVILQMKYLRLGELRDFPFLEPPTPRMVRDGYETLHELGAIDDQDRLTEVGRTLARLPIDPRIGRMILAGRDENALDEVLVIAAALSVQDPRDRPLDKQEQADRAHEPFLDERSDFLTLLNIWRFFHEQRRRLSGPKLRKACKQNFLGYVRMREWHDTHAQLTQLVKEAGLRFNDLPAEYEPIHRALLTGLLSNIGMRGDGPEYAGARGVRFHIFPGSTLFKGAAKWVMAAELVETTRLYARCVARIQPQWVESVARHLVSRTYSEPRWDEDQGQAVADVSVSLFGLPIVPRRTINFGPVDRATARALFIHEGLVEGRLPRTPPFLAHNQRLIADVQALEAKRRARDLLVDAQTRYAFYDRRIPAEVLSYHDLERWRKKAARGNPDALKMTRADVLRDDAAPDQSGFPDRLRVGGQELELEYHLDFGHADDGVTARVPLALLAALRPERFEWLVPGLLAEKIATLIRTLPKHLRTNFVPAPEYAAECARALEPGDVGLVPALARYLSGIAAATVQPEDFRAGDLPDYLRMNFKVIDEKGKVMAAGRDLNALRRELGVEVRRAFAEIDDSAFNRDGLTRWDFDELPERVRVRREGLELWAYPGLVDRGGSVSLRLFDSAEAAARASRAGLRRLCLLHLSRQIASLLRIQPDLDRACLHYAPLGPGKELRENVVQTIADRAFVADRPMVRSHAAFEQRLDAGWARLSETCESVCGATVASLAEYHAVRARLDGKTAPQWAEAIGDMRQQLALLVYRGFPTLTPPAWLGHVPRYLRAMSRRFDKLANAGHQRDARAMQQARPLWLAMLQRFRKHRDEGITDPQLEAYRWLLEEMRVSLFAQELGTSVPVSPKRLDEQWRLVRS